MQWPRNWIYTSRVVPRSLESGYCFKVEDSRVVLRETIGSNSALCVQIVILELGALDVKENVYVQHRLGDRGTFWMHFCQTIKVEATDGEVAFGFANSIQCPQRFSKCCHHGFCFSLL